MNFEFLARSLPLFGKGALMTLQLLSGAAVLSLSLGMLCGILCCNRLKLPFLSPLIEGITFILRAVPFYVQLLLVYFVLPECLSIDLNAFTASVLALGCCSAGYVAQIIRSGINAIPMSQWESGYCLGYNPSQSLRALILPQTLRNVLPQLNNELESLLKSTAITSSIGLLELTRSAMNLVSREMLPLEIYLTLAVFYLCLSALLTLAARFIERRFCNVND